MTEPSSVTEPDVPEESEWPVGTSPYDDLPVIDGVGIQDDEATELDPEVG